MRYLLLALALCVCCCAQSKSLSEIDGTNWQDPEGLPGWKSGYVLGYLSAMSNARLAGESKCSLLKNAHERDTCTKHSDESFDFTGITVGQFVDGMDAFYKDFRNRQLTMESAMVIVRDQIRGTSSDKIEARLVIWRACQSDSTADLSKCKTALDQALAIQQPTHAASVERTKAAQ
jgi:hypothetical protein